MTSRRRLTRVSRFDQLFAASAMSATAPGLSPPRNYTQALT
jgi:hypothetical protein